MTMLRTGTVGMVLSLAVGGAAFGQVRQVDLGRTMDANPQTGSGGSNQPIQGYVPVNGNEIMSGNVAGLKYFHGQSGLPNTQYEFQGRLGTSTLGNFARQSAATDNGAAQSYYLPSATVSTGQGGMYSAPLTGGFDSSLVPRAAVNPIAAANARPTEGQVGTANAFAFERVPEAPIVPGSPGALLSSKVFALRVPAQRVGEQADTDKGDKNSTKNGTSDDEKAPMGSVDAAVKAQQTGDVKGSQLNPKDKAGEDLRISGVYKGLLQELDKSADEQEKKAGGYKEGGGLGAAAVAEQEKAKKEEKDVDPLTGMPRKIKKAKPTMAGDEEDPLAEGKAKDAKGKDGKGKVAMSSKRLDEMPMGALRAGSALPPLKSFVQPKGGAAAPVDVLMQRAEGAMKGGNYLEAAQAYQLALEAEPGNTLALVGRANAELGAGMYQSAAYDLKFAFTRNPQMMGVRYTADTFLNSKRDDYLVKDLTTLSTSPDMADAGSFLLCYLHYQAGRNEQLKAELSKWGSRAGHDSWQSVVNKAWNPDLGTPAK